MDNKVQIIGLPRSGTRWLAMLVSNNFAVDVRKLDKHDFPAECHRKDGSVVLAIHKRIDHWLNSIQRNPVNLPETRPALFGNGELVPSEAVDLYNSYYGAWMDEPDVIFVDYTALLKRPVTILEGIAALHGWGRHPAQEWNFQGPEHMSAAKRAFYLNEL